MCGTWSYGIIKNSELINSNWISGSYENWSYKYLDLVRFPVSIQDEPKQQKRIETYIK